jgi:ATP-dependent Lon protease
MARVLMCDIDDVPLKSDYGNMITLQDRHDTRGIIKEYCACDGCFALIKKILKMKRKVAEQILEDLEKQYRLPEKKHPVIKKKGHK